MARNHRVRHGALLDAELLAQLYVELMGGRQIGLELMADEPGLVSAAALEIAPVSSRGQRAARPHTANADELARHSAFIEKISEAIWLR
jgi:DNA polymerase-3 subunit epsilon